MRQLQALNLPSPRINDTPIDCCDSIKILGVTLDSALSWFQHYATTAKKCHDALARLRKCLDYIPRDTKLMLVKALVFLYLDYCAGLSLSIVGEMCKKLDRCKNAALRFATGVKKYEHITPTYMPKGILRYRDRRVYMCICLLACILRSSEPSVIYDKFSFRPADEIGSKRRLVYELVIPPSKTSYYKKSFVISLATLWNTLPDDVRSLFRKPAFKILLENHMPRTCAS